MPEWNVGVEITCVVGGVGMVQPTILQVKRGSLGTLEHQWEVKGGEC